MRIARYLYNGEASYGVVSDEEVFRIEGDLFGEWRATDDVRLLSEVTLLAPIQPPNIIAIGANYRQHIDEGGGGPTPERPVIFLKATTSVVGPHVNIVRPMMAPDAVDYEGELVVVIGKKAKHVSEDEALDYVLGYTCGNDVTARDCQLKLDQQWARAKSFDTFCVLGPWIETDLDPSNLDLQTRLNGDTVQSSNTSMLIFSARTLVSYCSRNMTLLPGTIIMTGTPGGVGVARTPQRFLLDGDTVEVEIEGIGCLSNTVTSELPGSGGGSDKERYQFALWTSKTAQEQ